MKRKIIESWCTNAKTWITIITLLSSAAGYLIRAHVYQHDVNQTAVQTATESKENTGNINKLTAKVDILDERTQRIEKSVERILNKFDIAIKKEEQKKAVAGAF
jgi:hypothetical protein